MPPKRRHQITEYFDSDDECPSPPPAHIIQNHTHILSSSRGLSMNNTYYEMPASPKKQPTRMAWEPILWREDEAMSPGNNIIIHSDDEEDMNYAERMLEPSYVSTMQDEQVKRKRTFLGVMCSILFSSQGLTHSRITPFWRGSLKSIHLFKSFSEMKRAAAPMTFAPYASNVKHQSDVSTASTIGCFVIPAPSTIIFHLHSIESRYVLLEH
jgi:hypothetical protein